MVIILIIMMAIPLVRDDYVMYLAYTTFLSITLAMAWNILGGFGGQVSLGNAAFFGMGMYTVAVLSQNFMVGIFELSWTVIVGGVIAVCVAVVLSGAFKLRGAYFAMSTLFLNEVIRVLMLNWTDVTGGARGLHIRTPPPFSYIPYFYVALVFAVTSVVTAFWLSRSASGLALRCIRDEEDAALSLGVNSLKYKVLAMFLCAFFAGSAGAYHAAFISYIEPFNAFNVDWSLKGLFMTIVGGIGTIWGPVIGAIILSLLSEFLIPLGPVRLVVNGVLLIAFMLGAPAGIYGTIKNRWQKKRAVIPAPMILARSSQTSEKKG